MKRLALVMLMVLCMAAPALGASVSLSWQAPVLNCDDTDLEDLAGYVIKWWYQSTPTVVVEQPVGLVTTADIDLLGNVEGKTVVFEIASVDTSGNRSDAIDGCGASNQVTIPFGPVYPRPPTLLQGVTVP